LCDLRKLVVFFKPFHDHMTPQIETLVKSGVGEHLGGFVQRAIRERVITELKPPTH
jgi:hypothetical protein